MKLSANPPAYIGAEKGVEGAKGFKKNFKGLWNGKNLKKSLGYFIAFNSSI